MSYLTDFAELEKMVLDIKRQQEQIAELEKMVLDIKRQQEQIQEAESPEVCLYKQQQAAQLTDDHNNSSSSSSSNSNSSSSNNNSNSSSNNNNGAETFKSIALRLQSLKNEYINVKKEANQASSENAATQKQQQKIESGAKCLRERAQNIQDMNHRITQLQAERDSLNIFFKGKEKKRLDEQIYSLSKSQEQAIKAFRRDFKIEPREADETIEKLKEQAQQLQAKGSDNRQKEMQYRDKLQDIEIQYKTEKALAELRQDSEKINEFLERQQKPEISGNMQDKLTLAKVESQLNNISMNDYKKIMKRVDVEDAQKIDAQIETQGKGRELSQGQQKGGRARF